MGCGASTGGAVELRADSPAGTDAIFTNVEDKRSAGTNGSGSTAGGGSAKKKKPRTRRASVNVNVEDEEFDEPAPAPEPAKKKKPRGRRQSVEQIQQSDEDDVAEARLQPKASSKSKSKGKSGARATRRGSINNELDAMAMAAASAAAEDGGSSKRSGKKGDYLVPNKKYAADFKKTKLADLSEIATLGVGTFSRVKLVKHKSTGMTYALKTMRKKKIEQMRQTTHIMNEKRIMEEMDHPFIIQLMATGINKACLFMVTELVQGGELFSVLTREEVLDEPTAKFYTGCIVLAIEALHEKSNIYRDLKPENILLDNEGYAKLCDFGFAKKIDEDRTHTTCGTPEYVSPEMLQPDGHGKATDYWCIGIFVYECLCATTPFAADNYMSTYEAIQNYAKAGVGSLPWQSDTEISSAAKGLISGFLHPSVGRRLGCRKGGVQEIRDHIWFKGFDWDDLYHKRLTAPFVPEVKSTDDFSNFDTEEYGDDSDAEDYKGDGDWYADF